MNVNGVLGSLCFPSLPGFAGHNFLKYKDRGAGLAAVRAYNDWHFEDWCSPYAERFIPMAVVPLWDGQLAAAEMERMARRGVHALTFPDNPTAWGLPSIHSPEWDALWKTCADYEAMICRSEEHTSELQSLMRISYAVFCSKIKKSTQKNYRQLIIIYIHTVTIEFMLSNKHLRMY